MLKLLAQRQVRLFLLADTFSNFGSFAPWLALAAGYLFIRRPVPGADELSREQAGEPAPQPG
jgi:hypothetical protein